MVPNLKWLGCRMPVSATPGYGFGSCPSISETNGWSSCVMERMGIPMYFSAKKGGAVFMDGPADAYMTDEEIMELLRGPLFLAADTAKRLIDRGFGKYLGVDIKPWEGPVTSGEILNINGNTVKAQQKVCQLIPLNDAVRADSTVFHLRDGKIREPLFPGVTIYKNELGGMSVVFSGTPKSNYNIVEAFSFLTESRKRQLVSLIKEAGQLPIYYPGDAEVYFRAAECPDGKLMAALFDLSLDVLDEIPLVIERPVNKVERMQPDGTLVECSFRREGERLIVETMAGVLDPTILFFS
jgi:hypothetical protein